MRNFLINFLIIYIGVFLYVHRLQKNYTHVLYILSLPSGGCMVGNNLIKPVYDNKSGRWGIETVFCNKPSYYSYMGLYCDLDDQLAISEEILPFIYIDNYRQITDDMYKKCASEFKQKKGIVSCTKKSV